MREVKASSAAKAAKGRSPSNHKRAHKTIEEALSDLRYFISGQEHMPDVPLQLNDLIDDIQRILDDELISSLEKVYEDALFSTDGIIDQERVQKYYPTHRLIGQLRDLQKTRLRDAIDKSLKASES